MKASIKYITKKQLIYLTQSNRELCYLDFNFVRVTHGLIGLKYVHPVV